MILINKAYAKVWKVDVKEKYTSLQITTGDKQADGSYKNSSWNARLVGKAKDILVNKDDRIEIKSAKIENIYDKVNKKSWLNIIIFDFENKDTFNCPGLDDVDAEDDGFYPIDAGGDELPF